MNTIEILSTSHNWNLPTVCPVCGGELSLSENHCQLKCMNENCKSKTSGRISKWTNTIGAKEFGLKTIELLIDNGIIDSISSLYTMDLEKIACIERMGKRSAAKMNKELENHKEMTLAQFIAGYNIDGIGETVIDNIIKAKGFKTFGDFFAYSKSDKRFVCDGVGDIISSKLSKGLEALREDMENTLKFVNIRASKALNDIGNGILCGKSFCFTGAASVPRKDLWEMVVKNGGVIHESIKKDTNVLVLADVNSTSSKAIKARKQGTTLMSEDEFLKLCGN